METGFILLLAFAAVAIGLVIGVMFGKVLSARRYKRDTQFTQGTLNAFYSDSESDPGFYLGLGVPAKDIVSRKYVTFDVKLISQNSRR